MTDREVLSAKLKGAGVAVDASARVLAYWEQLCVANQEQNLTRLTAPDDFFSGFVTDALELRRARMAWGLGESGVWMDLGSGAGVPGLLSAAIHGDEGWVLVDSEGRKVEFMRSAAAALGLSGRVRAVHGRVESLGPEQFGQVVVSKAVGKVEKIYGWLRERSTWNSLVLLKGPRWGEEWGEFLRSRDRAELEIRGSHEYQAPAGGAQRVIIHLARVPRGTRTATKRP